MSSIETRQNRCSSIKRNFKGSSPEFNTVFKSTQDDENPVNNEFLLIFDKKKLHHKSSSLTKTKGESQRISSNRKEENDSNENKKDIESMMMLMKKAVVDKMIQEMKSKESIKRKKRRSASEIKSTLTSSKQKYEECIQNIYSLFQDNTKMFYKKVRIKKEEVKNNNEQADTKELNELMKKEIESLNAKTKEMMGNISCLKKGLKSACYQCKEMSELINDSIEQKKSLTTGILIIDKRMERLKHEMNKHKQNETNIVDNIAQVIENFG